MKNVPWAVVGFVGAWLLVPRPVPPSLPLPEACEPLEVLAPCAPVESAWHVDAAVEPVSEPASAPEAEPDVEAAEAERDDLIDCLQASATVWLDCTEAPCILAAAAPPAARYTRCFERKVTWRTVSGPNGERLNVGCSILGEPDLGALARRNRIMTDMVEHARNGALTRP